MTPADAPRDPLARGRARGDSELAARDRPVAVDLSQPFSGRMTGGPPYGDPDFSSVVHELCGHPFAMTRISMAAHTGTHVDAPRHFLADGKTIDEYPAHVFTGPGVVLDVRRDGLAALTAAELAAATPGIRPGEIVLLYFGYAGRFGTAEYAEAHPYLSDDAAEYLVAQRVPLAGFDLPTPDLPRTLRGVSFGFPVHRILLSSDCLIIENLGRGLEALVGQRVDVFAAPLLVEGADGAPARVVALPPSPRPRHTPGDLSASRRVL